MNPKQRAVLGFLLIIIPLGLAWQFGLGSKQRADEAILWLQKNHLAVSMSILLSLYALKGACPFLPIASICSASCGVLLPLPLALATCLLGDSICLGVSWNSRWIIPIELGERPKNLLGSTYWYTFQWTPDSRWKRVLWLIFPFPPPGLKLQILKIQGVNSRLAFALMLACIWPQSLTIASLSHITWHGF